MSEPWEPRIVIHDIGTPFPAAPAEPSNPRSRSAQDARRLLRLAPRFWESLRFLVLGLVPVALTLFLVISIAVEIYSDRIEIAPIAVPEDLQKQGYTPETVARQLFDEMSAIQRLARTTMRQQETSLAGGSVNFTLPSVGLSLNAVVQIGRRLLGIPQRRVTGEITKDGEDILLRLRFARHGPITEAGRAGHNGLRTVLSKSARELLLRISPYVVVSADYETTTDIQALLTLAKKVNERLPWPQKRAGALHSYRG